MENIARKELEQYAIFVIKYIMNQPFVTLVLKQAHLMSCLLPTEGIEVKILLTNDDWWYSFWSQMSENNHIKKKKKKKNLQF